MHHQILDISTFCKRKFGTSTGRTGKHSEHQATDRQPVRMLFFRICLMVETLIQGILKTTLDF